MLWITILEFAVVTIGVKIFLGVAIIYLVLPTELSCPNCDADTVALRPSRGLRWLSRLCRVRTRWCPSCGLEHLTREKRHPPPPAASPAGARKAPVRLP